MAVAWIGNRAIPLEQAVKHAATLLQASRCPVFSFDTDIHGTRAAIALASRAGAAYDHIDGDAVAREAALFTGRGGMFVSPGETRRRADVIVLVGALPDIYRGFVADLARTAPDLSASSERRFFAVGDARVASPGRNLQVTRLSCGRAGLDATLAALRAQHAGRPVSKPVSNLKRFAEALASARFPVFLFSGRSLDDLALGMLQGLIADINKTSRASALHLPASESGWGAVLASTWTTGFPPRTGFVRGRAEFDPWRLDVRRALAAGEVDFHLWVNGEPGRKPPAGDGARLVALTGTDRPVGGADVTIAIGEAGKDHNCVSYSARTGNLVSIAARQASGRPAAATILCSIAGLLPEEASASC